MRSDGSYVQRNGGPGTRGAQQQLIERTEKRLKEATTLEEENAFKAEALYKELEATWKKTEVGTKAADRAKELKKDKAFQEEVKVGKMICQVDELCAAMKAVDGKYNPDHPANRDPAAQITQIVKQLKKHPESKSAKKCIEGLKDYGL
jgi:hypothetical protein